MCHDFDSYQGIPIAGQFCGTIAICGSLNPKPNVNANLKNININLMLTLTLTLNQIFYTGGSTKKGEDEYRGY